VTAAVGLAERFARAFMTIDPQGETRRPQELARLGLADGGLPADRAGRRPRRVRATLIAAIARRNGHETTVTVAIDDGEAWTYLAVPVTRTDAGALYVAGAPAVVGAPATASGQLASPEDAVGDRGLEQMAGRVVRHFLAGDRIDLAADLVPRAVVSLPHTELRVAEVDRVTWAMPARVVAVGVLARGRQGLRLALRYELTVTRRGGRWLTQTVVVNPQQRESP
jgi:hypothetical protein